MITAYTRDTFLITGMNLILGATGNAIVLIAYISYLTSFRNELYHAEVPEEMKLSSVTEKNMLTYVVTGIAVLTWVTNAIYMMQEDKLTKADEVVVLLMEEAEKEINYKKSDAGLKTYIQVEQYLDAMEAYVKEDRVALEQYMETYSDNDFYKRLYYTLIDDIIFAKNQLLLSQVDTRLCHDILRYYKEQPAETQGKLDLNSIHQLLDMAEENTENASYQLLAVMGGASYRGDDANHYDRVIECAKRLDALVEDSKELKTDENALMEIKLYLARVAMAFNKHEAAIEFLKDIRTEKNNRVARFDDYLYG